MKLQQEHTTGINLFTGYGDGFVEIRQAMQAKPERFEKNLILLPSQLIHPWNELSDSNELQTADFEFLATLEIELVLLGTGALLKFPAQQLAAPLYQARIGFEVMDTPAACRTYNILASDQRIVAAALILTQS